MNSFQAFPRSRITAPTRWPHRLASYTVPSAGMDNLPAVAQHESASRQALVVGGMDHLPVMVGTIALATDGRAAPRMRR